jgi:hypothetical protein
MEGGTEFDLKALEVKDTVPEKPAVTVSRTVSESQATSKRYKCNSCFDCFSLRL